MASKSTKTAKPVALKPSANKLIELPPPSSVRRAREALQARANEILDLMLLNAKQAGAAGDFESAHKAYQYLLDHVPAEADGLRVVDISIDKPKQLEARPAGPSIQILGISLGGTPKALPFNEPLTIDATPISSDD